jgi:hypothetical protein
MIDDFIFAACRNLHRACYWAHRQLRDAAAGGVVLMVALFPTQQRLFALATAFFNAAQAAHKRRTTP